MVNENEDTQKQVCLTPYEYASVKFLFLTEGNGRRLLKRSKSIQDFSVIKRRKGRCEFRIYSFDINKDIVIRETDRLLYI